MKITDKAPLGKRIIIDTPGETILGTLQLHSRFQKEPIKGDGKDYDNWTFEAAAFFGTLVVHDIAILGQTESSINAEALAGTTSFELPEITDESLKFIRLPTEAEKSYDIIKIIY